MKFELPPPIPAKRDSPAKGQPPPRNEASPSVKPLPAVSPPPPPPVPPAPSMPAPTPVPKIKPQVTKAKTATSPPAGRAPIPARDRAVITVGCFSVLALIVLLIYVNTPSRAPQASSEVLPTATPETTTPGAEAYAAAITAPTHSTPAPTPSPTDAAWEALLTELRSRQAAATPADSPQAPPEPGPIPDSYRIVNVREGDSLNLRQGPGSNYPVVGKIPAGFRGITLGTRRFRNGTTIWQEISVGRYNGYVNEAYLEADTQR
jgi:hypothetical protein